MRAPVMNLFKKKNPEGARAADPAHPKGKELPPEGRFQTMPSWWVVFLAYGLAYVFCWGCHQFFLWFPPYLREVFKNLRGLPVEWADLGLFWAERGLIWIAWAAAVYHQLWQLGTRYRLSSHDIQVESWFPFRHVTAIPYGAIRKLGFRQSPLGMVLNYGHVEVDTGSPSGAVVLVDCPGPRKFTERVQPRVESILQPHLSSGRRSGDNA